MNNQSLNKKQVETIDNEFLEAKEASKKYYGLDRLADGSDESKLMSELLEQIEEYYSRRLSCEIAKVLESDSYESNVVAETRED